MGTRDLTHKAIAEALSNDRLLTHDQRAALLTLVADDSVWQRKHDEAAAEVTRLVDKCNSYIVDNARLAEQVESLRAEVAQARETAEYWKAEHLAGNARIGELHDELAATALRSADHLRRAIKAEAEIARRDAADVERERHAHTDWVDDDVRVRHPRA